MCAHRVEAHDLGLLEPLVAVDPVAWRGYEVDLLIGVIDRVRRRLVDQRREQLLLHPALLLPASAGAWLAGAASSVFVWLALQIAP